MISVLALIVIAPLLAAAAAAALIKDYAKIKYIALAGSVMSLLLVPLIGSGDSQIVLATVGGSSLNGHNPFDPLGAVMLLAALAIGSVAARARSAS